MKIKTYSSVFGGRYADVIFNLLIVVLIIASLNFSVVLQNDDLFILPEMAWFGGLNKEFLRHLLFFNQTRFTWVGDYQLVRPGLFFIYYIYLTIFQKFGYLALHLALLTVAVGSFQIFFAFLRYHIGSLTSFLLLSTIILSQSGKLFFIWPHINGYLISLALFVLAILLLSKRTMFYNLASLCLFSFAIFCHEFVAASLAALLGYFCLIKICNRQETYENDDTFSKIFLVSIPLILYGLVRWYVGIINTKSSSILSLDFPSLSSVMHFFSALNQIFGTFFHSELVGFIFFVSIQVIVVFNLFFALRNKRNYFVALPIALLALTALLGLRFFDRGSISPWYYPFLCTLAFLNIGIFWGLSKTLFSRSFQRLIGALFVLLLVSNLYFLMEREKYQHPIRWDFVAQKYKEVRRMYQNGYCFAGVNSTLDILKANEVDDIFTGSTSGNSSGIIGNKLITVMNQSHSCSFLKDNIPILLNLQMDPMPSEVVDKTRTKNTITKLRFQEIEYFEPQLVSTLGPLNTHQDNKASENFIQKSFSTAIGELDGTIELNLHIHESFPAMLNEALIWNSDKSDKIFGIVFSNNDIIISSSENNISSLLYVDVLHRFEDLIRIRMRLFRNSCELFINNQKVTTILNCGLKGQTLFLSSFNNSTNPLHNL